MLASRYSTFTTFMPISVRILVALLLGPTGPAAAVNGDQCRPRDVSVVSNFRSACHQLPTVRCVMFGTIRSRRSMRREQRQTNANGRR
jgi:hypothetical protein